VVVRFPGGRTLEIPDERVDLVRLAIDRMAALPERGEWGLPRSMALSQSLSGR
jgi:hypothetical protein